MDPVFKKMNFKGQSPLLVLEAPDSFVGNTQAMEGLTSIQYDLQSDQVYTFALVFVTQQSQIEHWVPQLDAVLEGDALLWFAYPKGSSKKYSCDFNRDTGWQILGDHAYEPVRMVAIDQDWSALRFRRVKYIKKITRQESFALSKEGKKRTSQKGK